MGSGSTSLWKHERVLGKGAFGVVSLVRSVITGELAAMKTIDRSKLLTENAKKTVEHEIRILKRLKHRSIVKLYEVIYTPRTIHLVLQYVDGGSVQQLLKTHTKIDEPTAQRLVWQLLDAVEFCHANSVCHRDLKLDNFMLDTEHNRLTLIDFGLSVVWREGQPLFKPYGTPCYMAPEIIRGQQYGPQVDIWSLGVALTCMLTGSLPFQGRVDGDLKRRIMRGSFTVPDHVSAEGKDLLNQMLMTKPELRIGIHAIRKHPWLRAPAKAASEQPQVAKAGGACVCGEKAFPIPRDPDGGRGTGIRACTECTDVEEEVLRRMEELAIDAPSDPPTHNHEHACYQMLRAAILRERRRAGACSATESAPCTSRRCT